MNAAGESSAWATRFLLRVGLVIYVLTVGIGIFNGFHFFELSRAVLLTHLHSGTLGWITIGAWAAALWAFGPGVREGDRAPKMMAIAFAIWVPLYILAFLSGNLVLRAIFGVPVLGMIVALVIRLIGWMRGAGASTPRLGMLLAFTVLVIGSTIGVLLQIQLAANNVFLPEQAIAGHAAAQVVGYLVLFALSLIDWRLQGTEKLGWAGGIQVVILFLAGILVAVGALFNIPPLLAVFIPLEIVAMIIFLVRVGRRVVGAKWLERGSSRHYAIAVPWVIVNVVITIDFIRIGIAQGFSEVPFGLFISADHAMFIGVMTNAIFGLIQDFTADRPQVAPWTEHVVFWVMNLALIGFIVCLLANIPSGEKFFVPFQGAAILLAIVVYSIRLSGPGTVASSSATPEPAAV
jgi:hypothetical protein